MQQELEACRRERDECLEGWKRSKADLENYKREEEKRVSALVKFSGESLIRDLLPVLDSFDAAGRSGEEVPEGLRAIRGQITGILNRHGVEEIKVSPGDPFDPSEQEAVGETESEVPEGDVAQIMATGYRFHEKILRAAQVKISKGQTNE